VLVSAMTIIVKANRFYQASSSRDGNLAKEHEWNTTD